MLRPFLFRMLFLMRMYPPDWKPNSYPFTNLPNHCYSCNWSSNWRVFMMFLRIWFFYFINQEMYHMTLTSLCCSSIGILEFYVGFYYYFQTICWTTINCVGLANKIVVKSSNCDVLTYMCYHLTFVFIRYNRNSFRNKIKWTNSMGIFGHLLEMYDVVAICLPEGHFSI